MKPGCSIVCSRKCQDSWDGQGCTSDGAQIQYCTSIPAQDDTRLTGWQIAAVFFVRVYVLILDLYNNHHCRTDTLRPSGNTIVRAQLSGFRAPTDRDVSQKHPVETRSTVTMECVWFPYHLLLAHLSLVPSIMIAWGMANSNKIWSEGLTV